MVHFYPRLIKNKKKMLHKNNRKCFVKKLWQKWQNYKFIQLTGNAINYCQRFHAELNNKPVIYNL